MRFARYCLVTSFLGSIALITAGCNSDSTPNNGPPGDTKSAYKSSEEAARDMAKNNTLQPPAKK